MKVAIVLHGNLRTFLMPTRENKTVRVCDVFMQNFVQPNNPDIFISTDTNDFYYNGAQYFKSKQIDIVNMDAFRLYHKVGFMAFDEAKNVITQELQKLMGNHIKGLHIREREEDISSDEKYQTLLNSGASGSAPGMIVRQYKDLISCHDMIKQYENQHNIQYDVILKCRFDAMYDVGRTINLSNYNYTTTDIYVPGTQPPLVYDFFAFGNKKGMEPYLRLYENLGCTLPGRTYMVECRNDGKIITFGNTPDMNVRCSNCGKSDKLQSSDVTIASEHHLYHIFQKLGIKYNTAGINTYVYRYRDTSCQTPVAQIIKNELGLNDVTLVNHAPGHKESSQKF